MIVTKEDIKKELQAIYPQLEWTVFTDKKYWKPTTEKIGYSIKNAMALQPPYIKGVSECEEFAFAMMVDIRRERAWKIINGEETIGEYYNWTVGVILVSRLFPLPPHWASIVLTSDQGILYVDSKEKMARPISEFKGLVHYLIM